MTVDIEKLEMLAKNATPGPWWIDSHGMTMMSMDKLEVVFNHPAQGVAVRNEDTGNLSHWRNDWDASFIAAANPAAVLELIADNKSGSSRLHEVAVACANAEQERDQLRAEIAGLKTGYEAYERVNAELRAENEKLRNNQSFSDAFYEVSGLLGVTGARPEAPLVVFRQEIVPALQAVIRNSRRYEWLRDSADSADWEFLGYQGKESTDQNIDAAMSKEQSHD